MKIPCEELAEMRQELSIKACAKKLKVSRATVCNWLKSYGLSKTIRKSFPPLTARQEEIITGSLLGDGFVDKRGKYNSRFNKVQCVRNKPYLLWMYEEMQPFSHNLIDQWTNVIKREDGRIVATKEKRLQKKFYTATHPIFTELRGLWYIDGVKIVPRTLAITPLVLAVWFADDGGVIHSKRDARIHTDGFTKSEVELLIEKLRPLGFNASVWKHYDKYDIGFGSQDYGNLMNLVTDIFAAWPCFDYKVNGRRKNG